LTQLFSCGHFGGKPSNVNAVLPASLVGLVGKHHFSAGMRELEYGTDLREIRPLLARWTGQVDPSCPLPKRRKLAAYAQDAAVAADLALVWKRQVESMNGYANFTREDFLRLKREFGTNWALAEKEMPGLNCPYFKDGLAVGRIE